MRIRDLRVLFFKLYIPIYNILDTRLQITYREKKKKETIYYKMRLGTLSQRAKK